MHYTKTMKFRYGLFLILLVAAAYIYKYPRYEKNQTDFVGELPPLHERVPERLRDKALKKKD